MREQNSKTCGGWDRHLVVAGILCLGLVLGYLPFLLGLARLAASDELYSHLPLIPAVTIYLLYIGRKDLPGAWSSSRALAGFWAILGVLCLLAGLFGVPDAAELPANDRLFLPILSLVLFIYAVVAGCFGLGFTRAIWFELFFLLFFVPAPSAVVHASSVFLQYASADALEQMLTLTGTTFYRDDLVFRMPGLTVEVALECSGIRSTLVLVVTALLAGHLFLQRRWKKVLLMLLVIPLGILRNAFRITTISLLTIHVHEGVIHGPIHSRGGPFFFVLSLVVLFALVFVLRAVGKKESGPQSDG